MKLTVGLQNADFYAFHGYFEEERKMGNHFILNTQITIDKLQGISDNINATIDYALIYDICKKEMEHSQKLLETVAENILNQYKSQFPTLLTAIVKINKLQPQLGGKLHSSFIELSI